MNLGVILLAAGSASRMGTAKQLLLLGGQTLIQRAARTALQTAFRPIIAVLGSYAAECRASLGGLECEIVVNHDWETGMGSSIRCGMVALVKRQVVDGVLILLHDQVLLTSHHLNMLGQLWENQPNKIVAAHYGDSSGTPAIFPRSVFDELLKLPSNAGAKKLISHHEKDVISMEISEAAFDVDTPEDYKTVRVKLGALGEE